MFDLRSGTHKRRFDKINLSFGVAWLKEDDRRFFSFAGRQIRFDTAFVDGQDTLNTIRWSYTLWADFAPATNRGVLCFGSNVTDAILFDLTTLDSLYTLELGEECRTVRFNRSGTLVATMGINGAVKVWRTSDGGLVSSFVVNSMRTHEQSWSHNDNDLAIGTYGDSLLIYDAVTGVVKQTKHLPNATPRNTAYRPTDSKYLLTEHSGHFFVFDGTTHQLLQDFDHWSVSPIGGPQFDGDGNMQWSPDGKKIALRDVYGRFIMFYIDEQAGQTDLSDNQWSINNVIQAAFPVRIGIDSAFAGDTVHLPVILNDPQSVLAQGATLVRVTCSYNTTMLLPLPDPNTNRDVAGRVDFAISLNASMDTVIGTLPFQAGLGNAISSTLKIELATTNSPSATLTPTDGLFTLRGICYEGGPRLMNPSGVPSIIVSSPHANDVQLPITLTLIEEGRAKLSLVDMLGRISKTFIDQSYSPGDHKLLLDLTGIANGNYLLILETPTKHITKTIEVAR
jgi:hypothetical protein